MAAFIWNANPARWNPAQTASSGWESLQAYLMDRSALVYWSTPMLQSEIKMGDRAFIWRTNFRGARNGIVAVGRVAEQPRQRTESTVGLFGNPTRLNAPGWNEAGAASIWKTGIQIERLFWDDPVHTGIRPPQGTVGRVHCVDVDVVERVIAAR